MNRIFNMDNKFFVFMGRVADLIILNLIFIVCCIPIVTIGPALTALYYMTLKMARNEETYIIRGFFKSFKENFRQAIVIWLIILVLILLIGMDFSIMNNMDTGGVYTVVRYGLYVIALILAMLTLYVFPVLSKFYNSIKNTMRNALLMALRHLPFTLLMLVVCIAPFIIMFLTVQTLSYGLLIMILLGFSLIAFINSKMLVRIFDHYIPKEEETESHGTFETLPEEGVFKNLTPTDAPKEEEDGSENDPKK